MNRYIVAFGVILLSVVLFFQPYLFSGKLPIPSDTIVGLYHPFRDVYVKQYPNGIPYKNFLITDPVRQQYPWRKLAVENMQQFQLPLWNPYNFSGTPLLANMQSAAFYPGNILFFLASFPYAWSMLILLQPLLAGIFLYLYLRNLRISSEGSILGSLAFAFSGFFIAWLEWGTVLHVALWLPFILYVIDKLLAVLLTTGKKTKYIFCYSILLLLSLCFSFFAGHLQTFFYLSVFVLLYVAARFYQYRKLKVILPPFLIVVSAFIVITSTQWYPTMQFILESARGIDQGEWTKEGWFIPWQHFIQFVVPDFFGNPASLNYWSEWNYAEFVGYVGIVPFVMALFALFFRRDKKTLFFGTVFFLSLLFAFPTLLAKLPYMLSIPFLSTAQPTRLLFLIDFSLAVLAAFGFDYFLKHVKSIFYPLTALAIFFSLLWGFVLFGHPLFAFIPLENIAIAKRNLILPTILFAILVVICMVMSFVQKKKNIGIVVTAMIIALTVFDLLRFGTKFTPFTDQAYLFPNTQVIRFLQNQKGQFRIMTTDSRMLPPNFSSVYKIQSIDGYDPLYLRRYGELIAASERKEPDIQPPFGFNRIITPHNYDSRIVDLLNVRYVLSLSELSSPKLTKVFEEGETRVYENKNVLPRAFFVSSVRREGTRKKTIEALFDKNVDLRSVAVIETDTPEMIDKTYTKGRAVITKYSDNEVIIKTENEKEGFLVLTDSFYPIWKATLLDNSHQQLPLDIIRTDYNFRGVVIPAGNHTVVFSATVI